MSIPDENVIIEGSLKRCKKYKLFKTKWIEHYFVLYCRDRAKNLYSIDEYKSSRKSDLKKSFKLEYVIRVESNLSVSDPSILCSAAGHHHHPEENLHSIFGVCFRFQNFVKELFLVAKNDEEMTLWVNEICKVCKLHRQNDDPDRDNSHAADSSISGMSMSSQSLDMSLIEQQQFAENNQDQKPYRLHTFKSIHSQQSLPPNPNYNNLPESRSETSSMYSSRRTEDDSVSYTSGPPIPPPRTRHIKNRFIKNGQVGRLHMIPASTSMGQVIRVEDAEDSSGETVKLGPPSQLYPDSVTSSEGISVYERNGKTLIRRAPPPVDRSNKPKNLKGEDDGTRYRNLSRHGGNENSNYSSTYSNRIVNYTSEASKRRNLDYFEPTQIVESANALLAASTRSPTPSDIEYITVDVDRTLAFKQMKRAAQSTD